MNKKRKEFSDNIVIYREARIEIIRKRLTEKIIKLKQKIKQIECLESAEEIKIAKELIQLCESRYGENFEQVDYLSSEKVEDYYQIVTDFLNKIEELEKKQQKESDQTLE